MMQTLKNGFKVTDSGRQLWKIETTQLPNIFNFFSLFAFITFILMALGADAFNSGTIPSNSAISGRNFRHGDLENSLKNIKFNIKPNGRLANLIGGTSFDDKATRQIYFGNWLRDYNQVIDVGTLRLGIDQNILVMLVNAFAYTEFEYTGHEFEVTKDRLGVYRPEEHIDNPEGYANGKNATTLDPRLRGPVTAQELQIDSTTGMKNYIANETGGWATSSAYLRRVITMSIEAGRKATRNNDKIMLLEAYRLLGQSLHTLEDFPAHSNYCELALIDLGYKSVFPHVGSNVSVELNGKTVFPIITGSFGTVDFFHSLLGAAEDGLSESPDSSLNTLEAALNKTNYDTKQSAQKLKMYLAALPQEVQHSATENFWENISSDDIFYKNFTVDLKNSFSTTGNVNYMEISPTNLVSSSKSYHKHPQCTENKSQQGPFENVINELISMGNESPEEMSSLSYQALVKNVTGVLKFQNAVMKSLNKHDRAIRLRKRRPAQGINKVFSDFTMGVSQPYLVPIIWDLRSQLRMLAFQIEDSDKKQWEVWNNPNCSSPTHSQLSKDHFGIYLNEPAGNIAKIVVAYTTPLIVQAWDNEHIDPNSVVDQVLEVFHHPAVAQTSVQISMKAVMSTWIESQSNKTQVLQSLGACGVRNGANHIDSKHNIVDPNGSNDKCW